MNRKEIKRLLRKATDGLTPAEKERIDRWYKTIGNGFDLSPFADEQEEQKTRDDLRRCIEERRMDLQERHRRKIRTWWYQVAAAILLIMASVWAYLHYQKLMHESGVTTHFALVDENLGPIKALLAKYGITPYAYGVVKPKNKTERE